MSPSNSPHASYYSTIPRREKKERKRDNKQTENPQSLAYMVEVQHHDIPKYQSVKVKFGIWKV